MLTYGLLGDGGGERRMSALPVSASMLATKLVKAGAATLAPMRVGRSTDATATRSAGTLFASAFGTIQWKTHAKSLAEHGWPSARAACVTHTSRLEKKA